MGEKNGGKRLHTAPRPGSVWCKSTRNADVLFQLHTIRTSFRGWVSVGVFRSELGSKKFVISEFCAIKKARVENKEERVFAYN